MSNACVVSQYLSGQGAFLLANRNAAGEPIGFREVGNVSALTIGVETTEFEHKESCTGARARDLTIVQEISATLTVTMESITRENLALALFGSSSQIAGTSVSGETIAAYQDKWSKLANIEVSSVIVTHAQAGAAGWVLSTVYPANSYVIGVASATTSIFYTAAGGTSDVTEPVWVTTNIGDAQPVDNTITDWVYVGETSALVVDTDYLLNSDAGSIKFLDVVDGQEYDVDYDFATQDDVQAIISSTGATRWARFEGLNTAQDPNTPVVVDAFKAQVSPLAELALITDEITGMEVEFEILSDLLQSTDSKFFQIRQLPLTTA